MSPKLTSDLLVFFGTECVHCHNMDPLVERLEAELKIRVQHIEIWHNAENSDYFDKIDQGRCGGVPFFFNVKTNKWICGEAPYDKLKAWAQGK